MPVKKYFTEEERKEGNNKKAKKYRAKNAEKMNERTKSWQDSNRDKLRHYNLWQNARRRAQIKGLEFTLTREDIVVPEVCPILGIPLVAGFSNGREDSPSVDRIDLSKGYTVDNIQIISYLANRMKNNATLEQIVLLGKWAEERLKKL
jgi:hypothetical protein